MFARLVMNIAVGKAVGYRGSVDNRYCAQNDPHRHLNHRLRRIACEEFAGSVLTFGEAKQAI